MSGLEKNSMDRVKYAQKLDGDLAYAWETWADSFNVLEEIIADGYYVELGFETAVDYVREQLMPIVDKAKLTSTNRQPIVKVLINAGFSNRAIASATGVSETQIRKDKKALEASNPMDEPGGANKFASNEVDAAGQSVEPVGHIEDDEQPTLFEQEPTPMVIENVKVSEEPNVPQEDEEIDRFAGIDFDAMIIPIDMMRTNVENNASNQIIETEPSPDTKEYFVPRQSAPKPLEVIKATLSPKPTKSYDDESKDFLEPARTLPKAQEPNKADHKHCRTCKCELLP